MIAPIGTPGSETRKRSDQILNHVIRPAVSECGYIASRSDEMPQPGVITHQVIQRILNDPLVVADLTDQNPNVFYELALRHAIGKPLVQLIEFGQNIPFDVAGMRTISVDHRNLDRAASARTQIITHVKAMEHSRERIETPISMTLDLLSHRHKEIVHAAKNSFRTTGVMVVPANSSGEAILPKPIDRRRIEIAWEPRHLVMLSTSHDGQTLRASRYLRTGPEIVVHWELVEYDRDIDIDPPLRLLNT